MNPGRIVMIVIGALLVLIGLGLGAAAAAVGLIAGAQRDNGYLSVPEETYSVNSYAITTGSADIGPGADGNEDIASLQVRGTGVDGDLFIGIGAEAEVRRYLDGVASAEIDEVRFNPFRVDYRRTAGTEVPSPPGMQDFWVASAAGSGPQEINWAPTEGDWIVVVMNADASPQVTAELQAGFRSDLFGVAAVWLLIGAVVLFLLGVALILAAILAGRKRGAYPPAGGYPGPVPGGAYGYRPVGATAPLPAPSGARAAGSAPGPDSAVTGGPDAGGPDGGGPGGGAPYPARLYGELDPGLSRWLWLVKWFLAIPHFFLLSFLWIAFWIATVVAGFAILFTARYPRPLFDFNVGVIRWSWRVAFYATGVLGTDRYPPFSLEREHYPADFDVDYPERMSRGLVLVKWWLLVIPQALIVGAFSGTSLMLVRAPRYFGGPNGYGPDGYGPGGVRWNDGPGGFGATEWVTAGFSLLGLLVFIAALALLFTSRYPRQLFDFIMGLQRWSYRVLAYTALLRDEYPPFRLDQGPADARDLPPAGVERPPNQQ
ncbi:DUF4389 domain-containing protein [Arthrobacter sp. zg-Y750]|uniref:DUF4389 domain-containing protein n=1 Tax=Arthrobacter sp. zg-Y750 TaxID=2894189 RepID=UPI001E2AD8BA|nr:DUF4389 domain-containing protein [Arthrobacter sp. zg-Y750]MCC9177765.1 DUF4389 domain-containing protein [Arthrobacter sp. zg-Y750]